MLTLVVVNIKGNGSRDNDDDDEMSTGFFFFFFLNLKLLRELLDLLGLQSFTSLSSFGNLYFFLGAETIKTFQHLFSLF